MQYLVVVWNALPYIAGGVFVTAGIVLAALALGFVLGVPLALAQAYGGSALRRAVAYRVGFFRGTPVLVLLFLFYFGLLVSLDLDINAFFSSCIVLGLTNEFSILLKDSAICFVLGTQAIMARTHFAASRTHEHLALFALAGLLYFLLTLAGLTFRVTEVFFGVGLYYLVLVTLTGRLLYILERRLHIPGLGTVPRNILQWRTPKKIEYFFALVLRVDFIGERRAQAYDCRHIRRKRHPCRHCAFKSRAGYAGLGNAPYSVRGSATRTEA